MYSIYFLTSLLSLLVTASPILPRAGGPTAKSIPSDCTIINPLPHAAAAAACSTTGVDGYMPSSNLSSAHLLYSSYFESSLSPADQATQCLQQCYGYGEPGQCKSALVGEQIPTPKGYFGTAGGVLETACLFYDSYMDPTWFVAAPSGQYVNVTAGNIYCPQ